MRCLRLSELAAGDFLAYVMTLYETTLAEVIADLPADLPAEVRTLLVVEFERGRSYIVFVLTLKLAPFQQPPAAAFAIAHYDSAKAIKALEVCLASDSQHPRIRMLQSPPLCHEAAELLQGTPMCELPCLEMYAAEVKFGWATERRVEAGHAYIARRVGSARNRSEAVDSLTLRMPQHERSMLEASSVQNIIDALETGRSPKKMLAALGMPAHPAAEWATDSWDPIYRKIAYRADVYSLYRSPRVEVNIDEDPPPPPPAAPDEDPPPPPPAAQDEHPPTPPTALVAAQVHMQPQLYLETKRLAAVEFMLLRLGELEAAAGGQGKMYSCTGAALRSMRSLMEALAPAALATPRPDVQAAQVGGEDDIWFSVVALRPSPMKRARKGSLATGDVGIAIHKHVASSVEGSGGEVVSSTPVNVTPMAAGREEAEVPVARPPIPLLMTPKLLSLEALLSVTNMDEELRGHEVVHGPG